MTNEDRARLLVEELRYEFSSRAIELEAADWIEAALRIANTVRPEGVDRASVIEECAAYLDGYAGGHYMAKSCATALRARSTSDDTPAAVDRDVLKETKISDCEFNIRLQNTLLKQFGDVSLYYLGQNQGEFLRGLPGMQSKDMKEIKEVIANVSASRGDDLAERYNELLYAVAKKFPGEDRHQTALRYIRERESISNDQAAALLRGEGK